jgi:hypothetical protein
MAVMAAIAQSPTFTRDRALPGSSPSFIFNRSQREVLIWDRAVIPVFAIARQLTPRTDIREGDAFGWPKTLKLQSPLNIMGPFCLDPHIRPPNCKTPLRERNVKSGF